MIVPALVPLAPSLIVSHSPPSITSAVQARSPPPGLLTSKVVWPAEFDTLRSSGVTTNSAAVPN